MKKTIYMAGVGGMLGRDLYKQFSYSHELFCSDRVVNEKWLHYLYFTDINKYYFDVEKSGADMLFHIGAMTDLEECEADPDKAYMTNTIGTENAVIIANKLDIPVVYISTAGIFNGKKESYDDWDTPDPINVYGRTKYLGEKYVVENARRYYVFRPGWMMGGHEKDKKFVRKILQQLWGGAETIYAVNDKFGSPTYTLNLASTILLTVTAELYGVYNSSGQGNPSRLEVARYIVDYLGHDASVIGVSSKHFEEEYGTLRPRHEVLENKKLKFRGTDTSLEWTLALSHYLDGYK